MAVDYPRLLKVDTDALQGTLTKNFGSTQARRIIKNIPQRYRCRCKLVPDDYETRTRSAWDEMYPRPMSWREHDTFLQERLVEQIWIEYKKDHSTMPRKIDDFGRNAHWVRAITLKKTLEIIRALRAA